MEYVLRAILASLVKCFEPRDSIPSFFFCGQKIEVIDSFLIPPNVTVLPGLLFVANATGEFGNFLGLVESLNLTVEFFHPEPHTLIAPTDDAFAKLGSITDDVETLLYVIDSHIVPGTFDAASLFDGQVLRTLSGVNLTVSVNNETGISIAGSTVVSPDLFASNGVIHGIGTLCRRLGIQK